MRTPISISHLQLYILIYRVLLNWIETVLGKAAMYLNSRIPELTSIRVSSPKELEDFEDIVDEFTGEVIYR